MYGDSMDSLAHYAARLGQVVSSIPGACDVAVEPIDGLPQTVIRVDREAAARWGTTVDDVNLAVTATNAGVPAGTFVDGGRRFDIVVRYDSLARRSAASMATLAVPTMMGSTVPLGQVATLEERIGPNQIQHDRARRRITVGFNVRGRDVQSIVTDVRQAMATSLQLPEGYSTHIGGQFENLDAARSRLALAVPVALLLIIVLLYATVKSLADTALIFSAIPLAAIGGVAALAIRGMPFSISAGVGFIALFGVAVLNGIVLVASFQGLRTGGAHNLLGVVLRGTSQRLRPVAMTALVASLGFLPMALSQGDGAEVQRPLATVVIGGLISSTMLTLLILPIMYLRVHGRSRARKLPMSSLASLLVLGIVLLAAAPLQSHVQQRTEDSAVAEALRLHPTLLAAQAAVRQAEAMEKATFDPGRTTVMVTTGQINSAAIDNNISIQQTLALPPVWLAEASLARARTHEAATAERAAMVGIATRVRQMYRRVVALLVMDSLYASHDSLVASTLAIARRRLSEGDASAVDVGLLEAESTSLRVQRHSHRSARLQAEASLAALTGSSDVVMDTTGWQGPLQEDSSALSVWDEQRAATAAVTNAQVEAERSQWWPLVTVGWFTQTLLGPQSGIGTERWNGPSDRFSGVTVGLHVPLWFPAQSGRLKRAEAESQAAQAIAVQKHRMSADLWRGHRNRLAALRNGIQEIRLILLPTTEAMVSRSRTAWVEGNIGIAEVQQALTRHLQARLDGIRASLEYTLLTLETSMIGDL
jgi:cobalt-zinc-cadmium resistance protein CzcA